MDDHSAGTVFTDRTMRAIIILIFLSILALPRLGPAQHLFLDMKETQNWKKELSTSLIASGKLPPKQAGQHLFGRCLINTSASLGVWSLGLATASLIDNGTVHPPREWIEDSALLIARPTMVLASSTFSMLLYRHIRLKTFLTATALNSAALLGSHFGGKLLSEEADILLQLTTTFFLVPLISTLYQHILASKEEKNAFTIGHVKVDLIPFVQRVNSELSPILGVGLRW